MISDAEGLLYSPRLPMDYTRLSPKGYRFGIGRELSFEGRRAWWNLYWLSDPTVDYFLDDEVTWAKRNSNVNNKMLSACAKAIRQKLGNSVLSDLLLNLKPTQFVQRVKDNPHSHLHPYKCLGEEWLRAIEKRSCLFPGVFGKADKVIYTNFGKKSVDLMGDVMPHMPLVAKQKQNTLELIAQSPWLKLGESVSLTTAEEFVRASAWWLTHSSGNPVRAPNHADRIYKSNHGWTVDFGACSFLVGKAIERCVLMLDEHIVKSAIEKPPSMPYIRRDLIRAICGAVAKKGGGEFLGSYPIRNGNLEFGAQAINLDDATEFMIKQTNIAAIS